MTIAACFLTPGGVVLGADSTTTISFVGQDGTISPHYFEHAQKLFEVGENATLGAVTWGLGAFSNVSYRTMLAELGDFVAADRPATLDHVVAEFSSRFWAVYASSLAGEIARARALTQKPDRDPLEVQERDALVQNLTAGFCIAGYVLPSRSPEAYELIVSPNSSGPPTPRRLPIGLPQFWGVPKIISRVVMGIDSALASAIVQSRHWQGSERDLLDLVGPHVLRLAANLPIREAIDYVHSVILTTCKGLKFSHLPPVCGGPAEIAVITTDRRFRWVTHKTLGEALP